MLRVTRGVDPYGSEVSPSIIVNTLYRSPYILRLDKNFRYITPKQSHNEGVPLTLLQETNSIPTDVGQGARSVKDSVVKTCFPNNFSGSSLEKRYDKNSSHKQIEQNVQSDPDNECYGLSWPRILFHNRRIQGSQVYFINKRRYT